ncbi:hypothetical protein [Sphingomonas aracearum]|uniref:Uncharacterized protein n=1 Tax=Sphingomonas aracearum TaxID=2283317 RepID=A0A369VUQ4_9SPHN|nr:hypothetical protein [Sphingomonas aracearum]RDE05287.1 hypothetical protein DVW87_08440 [Sphingomonas aracearum]
MRIAFVLPLLLLVAAKDKPRPKPTPTPTPLPASIDGLPIGALPRQSLPARGCAAYLWSAGVTKVLIAMAGADPAQLRLSLNGKITDLPRTAQRGGGLFGLSETNEYAAGGITAVLDLSITTRGDVTRGALVPQGTLRLDQPGADSVVVPLGGLIGCA